MQSLLMERFVQLRQQVEALASALAAREGCALEEFREFHAWVERACLEFAVRLDEAIEDLSIGGEHLGPELLSRAQTLSGRFVRFNRYYAGPSLRMAECDRLAVSFLRWVHAQHQATWGLPPAVSDGVFGVLPVDRMPVVYTLPPSARASLLELGLFLHEFGHLLYAAHQPEMVDLVRECQRRVGEQLIPAVMRNDAQSYNLERRRDEVVVTWFEWMQELFADAVGCRMAGPAFARALSTYLQMQGPSAFHRRFDQLLGSSHPPGWVRIRVLSRRLEAMGEASLAKEIELEWEALASFQALPSDFLGFFDEDLVPAVDAALDDMLVEAAPRQGRREEFDGTVGSPIGILNRAWRVFRADAFAFPEWERSARSRLYEACRAEIPAPSESPGCVLGRTHIDGAETTHRQS